MSIRRVLAPRSARPVTTFIAMVLLPQPPLALMTVMILMVEMV
jgi:hypothetical protein